MRIGPFIDENGDHDRAEFLLVGLADRPSYSLDDVDGRAARVDEATPSMLGTSTPSLRQRALLSRPRSPGARLRKRNSSLLRCSAVIVPETCSLHTAPPGLARAGIQPITSWHVGAELPRRAHSAMERDDAAKVVPSHRLGEADLPARLRASVSCLPNLTKLPALPSVGIPNRSPPRPRPGNRTGGHARSMRRS